MDVCGKCCRDVGCAKWVVVGLLVEAEKCKTITTEVKY